MSKKPKQAYTRLTEPLVRDGGVLRPATWDEALTRAADGFRRNLAAHGPDAFGMFWADTTMSDHIERDPRQSGQLPF